MFDQLDHKDLTKICLNFNFELTLVRASASHSDIELEQLTETQLEDKTLNESGDVSVMSIFPPNINNHSLDNLLELIFTFDQTISKIYK